MAFILMQADKAATSASQKSRVVDGPPRAIFMSGGGKGVVEDKSITLMLNMGSKDKEQAGLTIGINELAMSLYAALDFDKTSQIWESIIDDNELSIPKLDTSYSARTDPVEQMSVHRSELSEFIGIFENVLSMMKADLPRYDEWIERFGEDVDR